MKQKAFNIQQMAKDIGWHDYDIKLILNIPLNVTCKAPTMKQARDEAWKALNFSEAQKAAVIKCDELCIAELEQLNTLKEVKHLARQCLSHHRGEAAVLEKEMLLCTKFEEMDEIKYVILHQLNSKTHKFYFKRKLELVTNLDQAKALFEECPPRFEVMAEIIHQWELISQATIAKVQNVAEMAEILPNVALSAKSQAMVKWLEVCQTGQEVEKLFYYLFNKRAPYPMFYEDFLAQLNLKWVELSTKELAQSQTFDEALKVVSRSPRGSEIQIKAVEKCLEFADSVDLASTLFCYLPDNYKLKMKVFNKWLSLMQSKSEVIDIFRHFSDKSPGEPCKEYLILDREEVMEAIIKKLATFY